MLKQEGSLLYDATFVLTANTMDTMVQLCVLKRLRVIRCNKVSGTIGFKEVVGLVL